MIHENIKEIKETRETKEKPNPPRPSDVFDSRQEDRDRAVRFRALQTSSSGGSSLRLGGTFEIPNDVPATQYSPLANRRTRDVPLTALPRPNLLLLLQSVRCVRAREKPNRANGANTPGRRFRKTLLPSFSHAARAENPITLGPIIGFGNRNDRNENNENRSAFSETTRGVRVSEIKKVFSVRAFERRVVLHG